MIAETEAIAAPASMVSDARSMYLLFVPWVSVVGKTRAAIQVMLRVVFVFVAFIVTAMNNCPARHPVDTLEVCGVVGESSTRVSILVLVIGSIWGGKETLSI